MAMLFDSAIWGVDSYAPADRPAQNCLYDQVVKRRKPAFWGRYIRCPNASDPNTLSTSEARFLHDRVGFQKVGTPGFQNLSPPRSAHRTAELGCLKSPFRV